MEETNADVGNVVVNPVITGSYLDNPLNKEQLRSGDTFVIKQVKEIRDPKINKGRPKQILVFEEGDTWANWTSITNLMDSWGSNTSEWIGKKVKLKVAEMMINKELKKVLYFSPSEV